MIWQIKFLFVSMNRNSDFLVFEILLFLDPKYTYPRLVSIPIIWWNINMKSLFAAKMWNDFNYFRQQDVCKWWMKLRLKMPIPAGLGTQTISFSVDVILNNFWSTISFCKKYMDIHSLPYVSTSFAFKKDVNRFTIG